MNLSLIIYFLITHKVPGIVLGTGGSEHSVREDNGERWSINSYSNNIILEHEKYY